MAQARWKTAPSERIYAIGNVYARLDLLVDLIGRVRQDSAERDYAKTTIVQLGNLIDRGPSSAELMRKFMNYTANSPRVVVLKGSHEAMMSASLAGNLMMLGLWTQLGGDSTLASWGVDPAVIASKNYPNLLRAALQVIPREVIEWLHRLPPSYCSGDYLFANAGDVPEAAPASRRDENLLCVSSEFIEKQSRRASTATGPDTGGTGTLPVARQIGTAASFHRPGRLTALALEAAECWMVQAGSKAPNLPRTVAAIPEGFRAIISARG